MYNYILQVIVGGVNLLEHAEEQERLLDKSAKELEKRKRKEKQLRSQLEQKEAEKLDIEEKYANLQEEAAGKTKRLKEVWKQFQQTKEEVHMYINLLISSLSKEESICGHEIFCVKKKSMIEFNLGKLL